MKIGKQNTVVAICIRRWLDVLLMAVVGGAFIAALVHWKEWSGISVSALVGGVLVVSVWLLISVISGWSLLLNRFGKYPPTSVAIIFGYGIYLGLIQKSWMAGIFGVVIQTIGWLSGKILVAGYQQVFAQNKKQAASKSEKSKAPAKHWFLNERPLSDPDLDLFKIRGVEKQIVKLINARKNVAVLGKYGSGKSTVIEWAQKELIDKPENEFVICPLGAWGRRREGFSSHLLHMATVSLKPYVDTLSFIDIPLQYHSALASHGFWGELFASALSSRDPADVLTRLDEALLAAEKKLLFVIEDVDRNRDEALLKEDLPALLDRINCTDNIRFVLAVDAESADAAWLLRVASCVDVPIIEAGCAGQKIEDFRKLLSNDGNDWIDPVPQEAREEWFSWRNPCQGHILQMYLDSSTISLHVSLVKILSNPRVLKAVFRETWEKWKHLKGEVDPDDLLVLTTVKVALPELYQLLIDQRSEFVDISEQRDDKKKVALKSAVEQALGSVTDSLGSAIDSLLNHLFLHWTPGRDISIREKPQSIAKRSSFDSPSDYWSRVQRGHIVDPVMDQDVLKLLQEIEIKQTVAKELAEKIYTQDIWAKKVAQFGPFMLGDETCRLILGAYFNLLINDSDIDRHDWRSILGWDEVTSLVTSDWPDDFDGETWWYDHAVNALSGSLNLAQKIMCEAEHSKKYGKAVSKRFHETLKGRWLEKPEMIAECVSKDQPYALHNLMLRRVGYYDGYPELLKSGESWDDPPKEIYIWDQSAGRSCCFRSSDWQWFIIPLLEAMKTNAELLLPMLSVSLVRNTGLIRTDDRPFLYVKEHFSNYEPKLQFFDEFAAAWFGEDIDRLADLFAQTEVDWPKGWMAAYFLVAKKWAQKNQDK